MSQQPTGYGGAPLATWGPRVGGYLIDYAIVIVIVIIAIALARVSFALTGLLYLVAIAAGVYLSVQVGQTGQSPGMRVMGLKCVSMNTGQPIGGGMGFVRTLAHIVDSFICYIGWLFPLWDSNRQTLADKMMNTVVIVVPKQAFSLTPP